MDRHPNGSTMVWFNTKTGKKHGRKFTTVIASFSLGSPIKKRFWGDDTIEQQTEWKLSMVELNTLLDGF